jgi:hypothetical protein
MELLDLLIPFPIYSNFLIAEDYDYIMQWKIIFHEEWSQFVPV